jgi:CRP-like cAMP-binding protein
MYIAGQYTPAERQLLLVGEQASGLWRAVRDALACDQQTLATLGRAQSFGETALLRSSSRNATVRCVEAMDVLSLPRREFTLPSEHLPQLRQAFQRTSDERGARSVEPDAARAETRSSAG